MKNKLKVGQVVYRRAIKQDAQLVKDVVATVGKKYFTLESSKYTRYLLETMCTENENRYRQKERVYVSMEEYEHQLYMAKVINEIRIAFSTPVWDTERYAIQISDDQYLQVHKIIYPEKHEK